MYSQSSEEKYILEYFGSHVGSFIDIGANDGKTLSNTFALAEKGWTGVLVEPSPIAFAKLKDTYSDMKGFYFYPYALGESNNEVILHDSGTHLNKNDHGLLSTILENEKKRWKKEKFEEVKIKCFRWKTFLNRLKIKTFDFISLDAEGLDLKILKQINLSDTKLVCVEWNSIEERRQEFLKYCSGYGLEKIIYTSAENLLIAR